MPLLPQKIHGHWIHGRNAPRAGVVLDFDEGELVSSCDQEPGASLSGAANEFLSDTGESGEEMLIRLLRPPLLDALRYGALREAITFASYVAVEGFGETRAWENDSYVVDSGEGSCGIVRFTGDSCVAAMTNYTPHRSYDVVSHVAQAPARLQEELRHLCAAPMLNSEHQRDVSAVFWAVDGVLAGAEPWPTLYQFGAEMLRREMLTDSDWRDEAHWNCESMPLVLDSAIRVARRLVTTPSAALLDIEQSKLLPQGAPNISEARDLLSAAGVHFS